MKEKTFGELIKPHQKRFDYHNSQRIYIDKYYVLKLLKQVREATIAECKYKIWNEYGLYRKATEIEAEFDKIKTDRIKTEK